MNPRKRRTVRRRGQCSPDSTPSLNLARWLVDVDFRDSVLSARPRGHGDGVVLGVSLAIEIFGRLASADFDHILH